MPPQRGTLNFVNGGVYVVLSLPVSAFPYASDGLAHGMSQAAYARHLPRLTADVQAQVQLWDDEGPLLLEGTFLNFSPPDEDPAGPATQLVVLGRFQLRHPQDAYNGQLRYRVTLYGDQPDEQRIVVTATRADPVTGEKQRQLLVFGPEDPEHLLFPSAMAVLRDDMRLGATHILSGADHLLFLLAVLAGLTSWRLVLMTLTAFTAGHAATLSLSLLGGVQGPSAVVEPCIALTLVGVVLHDGWTARNGRSMSTPMRLWLVFGCALVHGLGLAGALEARGLDRQHLWQSLLGFNLGIELVQLAIGVAFLGLMRGLRLGFPPGVEMRVRQGLSVVALCGGLLWLVQRLSV
ncbi:HupE/UreJ family protein [Roseateles sp. SL47]|uniref:HupE/UreJ family protein n=1 Tax=Roseateles sp. SL47 TaxID=2995138 RepID=UPI00227053B3|nr:HupE/UreJ family protein [Roseateles sp. SL47]WAC71684.1 HupE/UreJ family protein [Roseateles sp. SL47]